MTGKSYAQMTPEELRQEIANLKEKARKAEQLGIVNEFAVYERKAIMAQAYLMDPSLIEPGEIYRIEGAPGEYFKVEYLKGRFAWGFRLNGENFEEALPISMLSPLKAGE